MDVGSGITEAFAWADKVVQVRVAVRELDIRNTSANKCVGTYQVSLGFHMPSTTPGFGSVRSVPRPGVRFSGTRGPLKSLSDQFPW